jgi:hypothetical protein
MKHRHTNGITLRINQTCMDIIVVECIEQKDEANGRVDVNED